MADDWKPPPVTRETVHEWTALDASELRDMILAVARAVGYQVVKITDEQWEEGHPDRVRFEVEEI